jgi:hypothetical protein
MVGIRDALLTLGITGDSLFARIREDIERGLIREARTQLNFVDKILACESSPAPAGCSVTISDDVIISIWRTARPSAKQDGAMVYQTGPYDVDHPTFELRRLVELAIEQAQNSPRSWDH